MTLFGRDRFPAHSTLSRFLAALTTEPVEVLRTLFLEDLLARQLCKEEQPCGLTDRMGNQWRVFDIDGTREAARQRALPKGPQLPLPQRRLDEVCAPGYTGRKRGEIVRTRTTVLQAHSYQWLGSFGNPGNGEYRKELRRAVEAIGSSLRAHQFPEERALLRLDGLYGTGAVLADLLGFAFVLRGKDYRVLDQPVVQARLHLPADQQFSRPESGLVRTLYDCPDVTVGASGQRCRLVVATHPGGPTKKRIGTLRDGLIYELFLTKLPQEAFTSSDVVALASRIVGPSKRPSQMRTRIVGVLMPPADKKPGRSSHNGCGTCASNWGIGLNLLQCAPPSLPPLSLRPTGSS
jgi:hypothetical protein